MAQKTPMMEQYMRIKDQHQDAFLFFRLGDFYEMFFEDAVKAAKELEITLTARGKGEEKIPMCGVPYHAAQGYISTLLSKGYKVAICEQTEDPAEAIGVVRREVVRIITPGTIMEGDGIQEKDNNYLVSITPFVNGSFGLAASDMTTGALTVTTVHTSFDDVINEAAKYHPREIVLPSNFLEEFKKKLVQILHVTISYEDHTERIEEAEHLTESLIDAETKATCYQLLAYLKRTTMRAFDHIKPASFYFPADSMSIDVHTKRNLELVETLRDKKKLGSLLFVLDETVTAMGGRLLKNWLERPLIHKELIGKRHELVSTFIDHYFERQSLKENLQGVYDLERLSGRVAFGNVNGRDLIQLKRSLEQIPSILSIINSLNSEYGNEIIKGLDDCTKLKEQLEASIMEDCPIGITEGGLIKDGYSEALDTYRHAMRNGKQWIAELEKKEKEATGIRSLKIGFNKVFGYYIEVTRPNLPQLPEGRYERKQTLTNAERFITEELKEKETLILEAEDKSEKLEYELFIEIRNRVKAYIRPLQLLAEAISTFDVLQSFAHVAEKNRYVMPKLSKQGDVNIIESRHPVVEKMIDEGNYIANDILLEKNREMLLITGPNMAGKSTYMRQLALISIMAQIGSYVPAAQCEIPIFDQIFTRIGAADDLAQGQSTFMVEMLETKYAVSKATNRSLILLDEIGRGTSTYDGMSLAQAIIEYIHNEIGAKTLFSTHYHELTALANDLPKLKNVHVSAKEEDSKVVFLHKVVDGASDRSYGIYVAQLAGLPEQLISRAKVILSQFEEGDTNKLAEMTAEKIKEGTFFPHSKEEAQQLSLFQESDVTQPKKKKTSKERDAEKITKEIKELNLLHITPIEAIQLLDKFQRKL